MTLTIRDLEPADAEDALACINANLRGPYAGHIRLPDLLNRTFRSDAARGTIALVGERGDRVIAFAALCDQDPPVPGQAGSLEYFHALPEEAGPAVWTPLWRAVLERAAKWSLKEIHIKAYTATGLMHGIPEDEEALVAFFEKTLGFERLSVEGYYLFRKDDPACMKALPPRRDRDEHGYTYETHCPTNLTHALVCRELFALNMKHGCTGWARTFATPADNKGVVVARAPAGEIAGYVTFDPSAETPGVYWGVGPSIGPVLTDSAHRQKGISTACCARTVHEILARDHCHAFLSARKDGLPAKKVYEPIGFRFVKGFVQMRKAL